MGVHRIPRIKLPFDLDRAGNAADVIQFGARAHIHQLRTRRELEHLMGFCRRERAFIGQAKFAGALLRQGQYVAEFSHCGCGD